MNPVTGQPIWNEERDGDGANDLVTRLPALDQGSATVRAINSAGVMVGSSSSAGGARAVLGRVDAQGRITVPNLGVFGSMTCTFANGINDKLQFVGCGIQSDKRGRTVYAADFIWENGVMKDLRLAPDFSVISSGHQGISETGVIWSGCTMAVPILPAP